MFSMNKKSFFLGIVTGFVIIFVGLWGLSAINQNSSEDEAPIQYFEKPKSFENKKETSFRVFQVLGNAALARESSAQYKGDESYMGTTVLILGEEFYSDKIVTVKNPLIIGTYSYTNKADMPITVPVIDGDIK